MTFLQDFTDRGYFYQCTNIKALENLMATKKIAAYIGFDSTADSLHVGSLMQIMILRLLQQHGHQPIIIIGGATTKIGDPTGRDESRRIISDEEMQNNIAGIKKSLSKFISFDSGAANDALLLNNSDWLEKINYISFLQNYGKFFSINRMLTMDSVKSRLEREQHLSFLELNYMLLQSYDFYHLNQHFDCVLQIGGSDQWGNIIMGADFIRKISETEAFGLTTPLLTTASGAKMGKSASGAVWLNEDRLSPYDYFQFWRNIADADVIRFAKIFAELNVSEFEVFYILAASNINQAKKDLAYRLTSLCHGSNEAEITLATSLKVFEEKQIDENLPTKLIGQAIFAKGIVISELLVSLELTASKSEAKKLIRGGGVRINDDKLEDENMIINLELFAKKDVIKLGIGKKKTILVKYY